MKIGAYTLRPAFPGTAIVAETLAKVTNGRWERRRTGPVARMETEMPDDPAKRGAADRRRVATDQGYELRYFARKHGLTTAQANELIRKIGNDRAKLTEAAVRLRRSLSHDGRTA